MIMIIRCDESVTSRRVRKTAGGKQMIVHILVYNLALGDLYNGLNETTSVHVKGWFITHIHIQNS